MALIQMSAGYGIQLLIPGVFLVLVTGFLAIQVKAARIHTSVELTPDHLRQGTERIRIDDIVRIYPEPKGPEEPKWQSARALGELTGVPRGRTGIGLKLTNDRAAQAWARKHQQLRAALTQRGGGAHTPGTGVDRRARVELVLAVVAAAGCVLSWLAAEFDGRGGTGAGGRAAEPRRWCTARRCWCWRCFWRRWPGCWSVLGGRAAAAALIRAEMHSGRTFLLVQSSKSVTLFHMTELARTTRTQADAAAAGPAIAGLALLRRQPDVSDRPAPAVLQNMLAELGQGVLDHSVFFADTAARVKRSMPPIFNTVYGSDDDNAGARGARLPRRHQGRHARRTGRPAATTRSTRRRISGRTRRSSSRCSTSPTPSSSG